MRKWVICLVALVALLGSSAQAALPDYFWFDPTPQTLPVGGFGSIDLYIHLDPAGALPGISGVLTAGALVQKDLPGSIIKFTGVVPDPAFAGGGALFVSDDLLDFSFFATPFPAPVPPAADMKVATLSFTAISLGTTTLTASDIPGTHNLFLDVLMDPAFVPLGDGMASITVVPEPATLGTTLALLGILLNARRIRRPVAA